VRAFRNPAFLAATATTVLLAIYLGLVLQRALFLVASDALIGKAIGLALLVLPIIGVWYIVQEWRLGTAVQRMSSRLEDEGRLPVFSGEVSPSGKLSDAAAEEAVEIASREVELAPKDWAAWFHIAWAYDAAGDRRQARKCLRYAAELYRNARV
jgi:tetratricopeptide (TPR) repeat protein